MEAKLTVEEIGLGLTQVDELKRTGSLGLGLTQVDELKRTGF